MRIQISFLALVAVLSLWSPVARGAGADWQWPEKAKNLKVLPKDTSAPQLQDTMKQFSSLLGVRCSYCHVGEEGKPLSTFDFVSDKNPNKDRAREMYRMVGDINGHLAKLTPSGDHRVQVWCHTCHRGRPRPITLEEELMEAYRKGGTPAAIARHRELKEKYAAKGAYDFSEGSLNAVAYLVLPKDPNAALAFARLNTTEFPQSGNVWDTLAEIYLGMGNRQLAQIYYSKSAELDPTNANALAKLKELSSGAK